ncbi:fumarylacetoacetate hydrolase family protein [Paenibacillus caui]|uniref:fumarylacetoacetate hydrolase family protein n=1 Tax=Paenibacillus caui TaxID=2873927 RepID=UPI001CA924A5|nr:fumarylacetoacetate hydrolase family protein [Paenibacillus caui]
MKLASVIHGGAEEAAIITEGSYIAIRSINEAEGTRWHTDLLDILKFGELEEIQGWYKSKSYGQIKQLETFGDLRYAPPYRNPGKIWGIGANYVEKAEAMAVTPPDQEPICFMKPNTSLIGEEDAIVLPKQSDRVTAEAELGIVIGKTCKNIEPEEAHRFIAAYTTTLDMTAQDIHARNPRFLGRSKSFDTFFSFGPQLVTPDEIPDLENLSVETALNGKVVHQSRVANMIYSPAFIVSFFSKMMTLLPGDIMMTGTPGSIEIHEGDTAECRIDGFMPLRNPVRAE